CGLVPADLAQRVHFVPAALDRGERPGQELLEVGQRGIDVLVHFVAQALGLRAGLSHQPGTFPGGPPARPGRGAAGGAPPTSGDPPRAAATTTSLIETRRACSASASAIMRSASC